MSINSIFVSNLDPGMITRRTAVLELVLIALCFASERVLQIENRWGRAAFDNAIHGLIAGLAWLIVICDSLLLSTTAQVLACAAIASAIDIDHFIAAGSLSLRVSFFHH